MIRSAIATLILLLVLSEAQAQVFRCTDADGQLKFSDQPCEEQEAEEKLDIEIGTQNPDNRPKLPANAGDLLREAARRGDTAQVEQLIDLGVDVNDRDIYDMTALHMAGHRLGRLSVVKALVDAGADVNARTTDGTTVLERSIYRLDIAGYLLEQGALVNARNGGDGGSVLHAAVKDPVAADGIIDLLLAHDADIDIRDKEGNTPLHVATWRADDPIATISLLLDRGAWIDAKNDNDRTALNLARERTRENIREQVVDLLLARGARESTPDP
jgi:ankyrin repeat protein